MTEPRKAAAAIIVDDTTSEILMAKRNESMRFMAGHHVFPGGRIDDSESDLHVMGATSHDNAITVHAVAREVFEETGVLCVRGELPERDVVRAARRAMLAKELDFDAILDRHRLDIHAVDFVPAGHWVTPPFSNMRFDTQYLLYKYHGPRWEEAIEGEMIALDWMTPQETRRRWRTGELRLSTPIAYVLQQMAALPYPEVLPMLRRTMHRADGLTNRFEIRCGVAIIALAGHTLPPATHTNCVVVGEREIVVIDPGTTLLEEQAHLKEQLDAFLSLGARIKAVVLTHSHSDHVGSAELVRSTYGSPIWAHQKTAEQLSFSVDARLEDGDEIVLEGEPPWRLQCIHTPGHDPGHLCLLEESTRTLIAGDMVANPGTIIISLDMGGDVTQFLNSLSLLSEREFNLLIPSHGMPLGKPKEKIQEQINHRLWREQKIRDVLGKGLSGVDALLPMVYDDVNEAMWPFAMHTLRAHLARIEKMESGE